MMGGATKAQDGQVSARHLRRRGGMRITLCTARAYLGIQSKLRSL